MNYMNYTMDTFFYKIHKPNTYEIRSQTLINNSL